MFLMEGAVITGQCFLFWKFLDTSWWKMMFWSSITDWKLLAFSPLHAAVLHTKWVKSILFVIKGEGHPTKYIFSLSRQLLPEPPVSGVHGDCTLIVQVPQPTPDWFILLHTDSLRCLWSPLRHLHVECLVQMDLQSALRVCQKYW